MISINNNLELNNVSTNVPMMRTIRQVASTGILPEHCIRTMVKENTIPYIVVGNRVLINFSKLTDMLNSLPYNENTIIGGEIDE